MVLFTLRLTFGVLLYPLASRPETTTSLHSSSTYWKHKLDRESTRPIKLHFMITTSHSDMIICSQCCDMDQSDTIGKIELNPSIVLSSDNTDCKNDIQLFPQLFDELSCCDMDQSDTIGKIKLNPLSSCQIIILIARMTFNCFPSCLMS